MCIKFQSKELQIYCQFEMLKFFTTSFILSAINGGNTRSVNTTSQSPIINFNINESSSSGAGLFKRRNAFWKVDTNRTGSIPDVPESKMKSASRMTMIESSSIPLTKQNTINSSKSQMKSKSIKHGQNEGPWLEPKECKTRYVLK